MFGALRVGFITYGVESPAIPNALEQKTKGIIRATISSGSHLSQTVILESLQSSEFEAEKQEEYILEKRANKVKPVLAKEEYPMPIGLYYPFNSGYFMCLKLNSVDAEEASSSFVR